jgi:putative dimethyl sulfoxide reductase chaperone
MTIHDSAAAAADAALARAVVYRALSLAFEPPTDAALRDIGARDRFSVVVAALQYLEAAAASNGLALAASLLESLAIADAQTLSADYWRLFGHTTRGLICACETEYGPDNGFHQPQQLADIAGYYLAFGLRPLTTGEVRPDHIACECEFMDFLSRKQARLLDGGDADGALDVTRMAERAFLRDHLGRFGRAFGARLASEDRGGFFGAMGHVLLAFVDEECARLRIDGGPIDLAVRPDVADDTPMACGSGDSEEPVPLPFHRQDPSLGARHP